MYMHKPGGNKPYVVQNIQLGAVPSVVEDLKANCQVFNVAYQSVSHSLLAGECCYFPLEGQFKEARRGQHEHVHAEHVHVFTTCM